MTERGGPTTQAGIYYQNSIAALALGDLLRWDVANPAERAIEVRVEAPAHVDDIVLRYSDGHREWIQAKLSIESRGKAWDKLWADFAKQRDGDAFGSEDRLVLLLGTASPLAQTLIDLTERAQHGTASEWNERLTGDQEIFAAGLEKLVPGVHRIFQRLRVERIEADRLERDFAPYRLPTSSVTKQQLLVYLRDLAGGEGRVRGIFEGARLRQRLRNIHALVVLPPSAWGLDAYLETVRSLAQIAVLGTWAGGSCETLFLWPQARSSDGQKSQIEDEFGGGGRILETDRIDLGNFPSLEHKAIIIHAGPGFGKSTLLMALSSRLSRTEAVPAIIPLAGLATTGKDVLGYLTTVLNTEFTVALDWEQLSEDGSVVLLFDGLDEVAPDRRAAVIRHLQLFTARFPNAAWMMTVRDPAVIPAGFDAPKYEIMPLSEDAVKSFVAAWRPDLSASRVAAFIAKMDAHQDLAALIRIPLFLSLLLATWDGEAPLPNGRADLIETYLTTLFRPDAHKDTPRPADPDRLRAGTQALSFDLLERGEIGAGERDVRKVMAVHADGGVSADQLYDDAIRCGLLRRQGGGRLAFPFPIVQEYLAACHLINHHSGEIAARAERAIERPWAQAIQFALEQLDDATAIAQALLDREDDAFASMARLLGRCIANGMHCDVEVATEVGRRLVAAWPRASYWTSRRIGQLLLDRWTEPLLPELRTKLHSRYLIHDGAGTILARLADDALNLSVARAHIAEKVSPNLGPLQELIMPLSATVFEDYLTKAAGLRDNVDQLWSIGVLLARLDRTRIERSRMIAVAHDRGQPDLIRLSVCRLLRDPLPDDYWEIIERGLRARDYHRRWAARDALDCVPDIDEQLVRLLSDSDIPKRARGELVYYLRRIIRDDVRCVAFVHRAIADPWLDLATKGKLRLWGAIIGDVTLFEALIDDVPQLASSDLCTLSKMLAEYPDRNHGLRLVEALGRRALKPAQKVEVARALLLGARYKLERFDLRGATLEHCPPHAAMDAILALIDRWRTTTGFHRLERLRIETIGTEAGLDGAAETLRDHLKVIILDEMVGDFHNPYNNPVRSALSALQERGVSLPLDVLTFLVETADSNARIGALYAIGALGTLEALDYLLALSRTEKDDWSSIFQNAEKLAARLNLFVARTPDGLALGETAKAHAVQ
jgi:NACHT domain